MLVITDLETDLDRMLHALGTAHYFNYKNTSISLNLLRDLLQNWQGRKDSNPRMPESKSGALTNLATPLHGRV